MDGNHIAWVQLATEIVRVQQDLFRTAHNKDQGTIYAITPWEKARSYLNVGWNTDNLSLMGGGGAMGADDEAKAASPSTSGAWPNSPILVPNGNVQTFDANEMKSSMKYLYKVYYF